MSLEHDINDFLDRSLPDHTEIMDYKSHSALKSVTKNELTDPDAMQADGKVFFEQNHDGKRVHCKNEFEKCNRFVSFSVYMTWVILMIMAYFREFLRHYGFEKNLAAVERKEQRVSLTK